MGSSENGEREERAPTAEASNAEGDDFGAGFGAEQTAGSEKGENGAAGAGEEAPELSGRQLSIKDMRPQRNGMNMVVKVLQVAETRNVPTRNGGQRKIADFLVGDSTGVALFSAKDAQVNKMTPGKLVRVKNGTVEVFRSTMRLVVDKGIGEIEEVADQDADSFSVKEDFNISLIEFDVVVDLDAI